MHRRHMPHLHSDYIHTCTKPKVFPRADSSALQRRWALIHPLNNMLYRWQIHDDPGTPGQIRLILARAFDCFPFSTTGHLSVQPPQGNWLHGWVITYSRNQFSSIPPSVCVRSNQPTDVSRHHIVQYSGQHAAKQDFACEFPGVPCRGCIRTQIPCTTLEKIGVAHVVHAVPLTLFFQRHVAGEHNAVCNLVHPC